MAITVDQSSLSSNSNVATDTSIVLTTSNTVAAGADIFLLVHWDSAGSLSVAGGGLTWTVDSIANDGATQNTAIVRATAPAGLASGSSITATFTLTSTARIIAGCSFLGLATAAKEDADATAAVTSPAWTSATVDPTTASNLVITAVTNNFASSHTPTAPNLETIDGGASFDYQMTIVYRINASAGSYTNSGSYATGGGLFLAATGAYGAAAAAVGRVYKRLYGPAQLTGSAADLYAVPASTKTRILHIHASNPSAASVDVNLSIGADAAATRVWDDLAVGADRTKDDYTDYTLAAGEKIQGWADSAATVTLTISGIEVPA